MISLEKLNKLPRHQRLRKIEKILTQYEYQLVGKPLSSEFLSKAYIVGVTQVISEDNEFDELMRAYLLQQTHELQQTEDERGPINRLRHFLLSQFGKTVADWDFIDEEGNLCRTSKQYLPGVQVFLEDIRSPFNVGAIFRTAECFGVEKVYLSPFCADPLHPRAERSAMGCVSIVPWERISLDSLEFPVFALETGGTPLDRFVFPEKAIMIVGSEELGISSEALSRADASLGRVSIPTIGAKGSLNVAVAFGIAMQNWMHFLCLKN
ncbi:TrmH family RNA methyltransferase [Gracilinema caldarium]|uniref:tRNA/rRNA methyltransferase (SpoU) n=1 Tax=Gracilinema caldarium (strain ATCC 51460 / DSM 7334 / H1) TaxID=744872 RepID=F8EWM4_GRAC1|nr:TrmH family RNA methyltransferase [Gracilinema caldarium]AEJ18187.1 tRNA/rRNA methyltransferase (SpoU) [Gracilinema caldarium DSM 7334]